MDAIRNEDKIWTKFQGKKSGKCYVIINASIHHIADITNSMIKYFLPEEPICKYLKTYEDEEFINELKPIWKNCVEKNMSLVCLTDEPNPQFAGFLLLCKSTPDAEPVTIQNDKWLKLRNIADYLSQKADPYRRLNISEYLTDVGLSTLPEFRGDGVAEKLLDTCELVCRQYNLPAMIIMFSSIVSQTVAKKIGLLELESVMFEELRRLDYKKYGIDNIEEHTKDIKYMYRIIT